METGAECFFLPRDNALYNKLRRESEPARPSICRGLSYSLAGGMTLRRTLCLEYKVGSERLVPGRATEPELAMRGEQK